jgi:MYXO-CTERM domain-containing protein
MRSVLTVALLALSGSVAQAHIHLLKPLSRVDDGINDPQKEQHCGSMAQTRTTRVTTYKPGETITVEWMETIEHTGWFRISFQPNGEMFRIPPVSNGPNGAGAAGNFPTENLTGMVDPGPNSTGSMILMDRIPDGAVNVMRSVQVTLPNMECTNCTLQFIQVMNNAGNAPYTVDVASNDIYFNCADLTLAANAPDAGVPVTGGADAGTEEPGGGGGVDNGKVSGGCSTGGGTGAPVALALLGLVGWRRRRR